MKKNRILLVDDDKVVLRAFSIGLQEHGFEVVAFDNAIEALDELKTLHPDIIVTDLKMEPMNGFDFYQEIKKRPGLGGIPCLFLTALDDPITQKYGATLGVDAYICKPVDIDLFAEKIEQILHK